jgi:hypothetical protein
MLADARQYHALVSHPWMLAPGGTTFLFLLVYLLLADQLLKGRVERREPV